MEVTLKPAEFHEYVLNLLQHYIYYMSEFMAWPSYENAAFNVDDSVTGLSGHWKKADHFPYCIFVDNEMAGFSLVRVYPAESGTFDIGQFFVLRKCELK